MVLSCLLMDMKELLPEARRDDMIKEGKEMVLQLLVTDIFGN